MSREFVSEFVLFGFFFSGQSKGKYVILCALTLYSPATVLVNGGMFVFSETADAVCTT